MRGIKHEGGRQAPLIPTIELADEAEALQALWDRVLAVKTVEDLQALFTKPEPEADS